MIAWVLALGCRSECPAGSAREDDGACDDGDPVGGRWFSGVDGVDGVDQQLHKMTATLAILTVSRL